MYSVRAWLVCFFVWCFPPCCFCPFWRIYCRWCTDFFVIWGLRVWFLLVVCFPRFVGVVFVVVTVVVVDDDDLLLFFVFAFLCGVSTHSFGLPPCTFPPSRVRISACPRAHFRSVLSLSFSLSLSCARAHARARSHSRSLVLSLSHLLLSHTRAHTCSFSRSLVLSLSRLILSHTRAHTCEWSLSFSRFLVLSCLPACLTCPGTCLYHLLILLAFCATYIR